MTEAVRARVALGSNLADPVAQVRTAFDELADLPQTTLSDRSRLYRSRPMGPAGQPDYVNAVALLETGLAPLELLAALQGIEAVHERVRGERWGPRTLDLDILLYGDRVIDEPDLTVPHPGLFERNFVLYPLADIEPGLRFPDGRALAELLAGCDADGLEPLESPDG